MDENRPIGRDGAHVHPPALGGELHGIGQQIQQDLLDLYARRPRTHPAGRPPRGSG